MKKSVAKIAVLGATGQVGREVLQALAAFSVPLDCIFGLGTAQSVGSTMSYGDEDEIVVGDTGKFDFTNVDLVISAVPAETAATLLPTIARQGVKVIDCSTAFRMNPDIVLAVAGINDESLVNARNNIVALPDAMVTILAQALKPLHDLSTITRVVVSTYQAASGIGRAAMDELFAQTRSVFVNDPIVKEQYTKQIAFNAIPQVGAFRDDGQTEAELMMNAEIKKLLGTKIKCAASCVYVPSFLGSALTVSAECANEIDLAALRHAYHENEGIAVVDHRTEEGLATLVEVAGEDSVFISRIRDDNSVEHGVSMWVVADTIRVGVALNAARTALSWLAESATTLKTATTVH